MKSIANEYQCLFHGCKSNPGPRATEASANTYDALKPIAARGSLLVFVLQKDYGATRGKSQVRVR